MNRTNFLYGSEWNHHPFQRGKQARASPLQRAGDINALSLAEAFRRLSADGFARETVLSPVNLQECQPNSR